MPIAYTKRDLESHDALGLVIRDEGGRYLCVFHNKFHFWTIPLGKAEEGQSIEEAVRAEAFEELDIRPGNIKKIYQDRKTYDREGRQVVAVFHLFQILDYQGNLSNKEPSKHAAMRFMALEDLRALAQTSDATSMLIRCIDRHETIA